MGSHRGGVQQDWLHCSDLEQLDSQDIFPLKPHPLGRSSYQRAGTRDSRAQAGQRDPQGRQRFFRPGGTRPPFEVIWSLIDEHRKAFGVEPLCRVLQVSPSAYRRHAARLRDHSRRSVRAIHDEMLAVQIRRVWQGNYEVYGARKVWRQMHREHQGVARCTVERLMREMGLCGAARGKTVKTTQADPGNASPRGLLKRQFTAKHPNQLWVADFTFVSTWQGFAYVAFIVDVYSRFIVGWRVSRHMRTEFVLDALEQALHTRRPEPHRLVHHSDRGSQYLSIRYSERLGEAGIEPSVGNTGDSYDNALAETSMASTRPN